MVIIQIHREKLTQELFDHLISIECEELQIQYRGKTIFERNMEMSEETGEAVPMNWYCKTILDDLGIKYGL